MKYTEAQQRSVWNKFREKTNLGRGLREQFSSSYQEEMEKLRNIDDDIREIASDLKLDLKHASRALKERRYLDLFHFADKINKTLSLITEKVKDLSSSREKHLQEFYGESEYYDPNAEYSFASQYDELLKNAGIWNSLFGSERERAAKALEKLYKKKIQKQKVAMDRMFRSLSSLVNTTLASFKEMGVLRAKGDLSDYIDKLEDLEKSRKKFSNELKALYNTYIKDIVEYRKQKKELEEQEQEKNKKEEDDDLGVITLQKDERTPEDKAVDEIEQFEQELPFPKEESINSSFFPSQQEQEEIDQGWEAQAAHIQNLLKISQIYKSKGMFKESNTFLEEAYKLIKGI